ncbi:hypothetical protein OKW26_001748 [Paraburkholderia sp. 32]
MRTTIADSDLAPSAVHAVIEIGMSPGISAKDLATILRLDAARHLYESFGFRLSEESEGTQWGTRVVEQRFNRLCAREGDNGTA